MSNPPFPNEYTLRTVAEVSSRPCFVCHKPTTKVLTTPGNKDFLYTCPSHLKDPGFASPVLDPAAEAARLKAEELQREKEAVIKEYEERMRKKRGWWKNMIGGSGGEAEKKKKQKEQEGEEAKEEREKDDKLKALDAKAAATGPAATDEGPREFTLHRNFYQMRIDRKQTHERAKRDQSRLQDPMFFPAAPKGDIV